MIKAILNNQNKNSKKDNNQIKNSSEHNKLIDNDNIKKSIQNKRKCKSKNKNKKRKFDDTNINIKGDSTRENITKNDKIIPIYNFCYEEDNILTKFIFKNSSKNFEFFYCYKKSKGCLGKGKYDKKSKDFKVYTKCDKNIYHEKNTYNNFEMLLINDIMQDIY